MVSTKEAHRSGRMRVQGWLRPAATLCVVTIAAAGISSSAHAAYSSHAARGKQSDKKQKAKHGKDVAAAPDSNGAGTPATPAPETGAAPGNSGSLPVVALRVPATAVARGVVTFRLRGIEPNSIRSAYLKKGNKKRRVPLARVRAAARRGVLRLRMAEVRVSQRTRKATASGRKRNRKPTLIVVTEPTEPASPTPTEPAPTPAPASPTDPAPGAITAWRAVRSLPLGDATARSLVTPRPETRPANAVPNQRVPTGPELSAFHNAVFGAGPNAGSRHDSYNPLIKYVTGGFAGTTDEIIQWGAHKWGIPEDVLRAVAVNESYWRQEARGDRRDGVNALAYPALSRIDSDSVYESLGITQVKWRPDGSLNPGTEPLRWMSTAFNVDYAGANVRYYYDGYCNWCNPGYSAGQAWESIGAHYSPSPWRNAGMLDYIARIQGHLAQRTWTQPGF